MKISWHPNDIKRGQIFGKKGITERWTIGYMTGTEMGTSFVAMSSTDFQVLKPMSSEVMAKMLTDHEYLPGELLK